MQAAQAFPGLLVTAVLAEPRSFGEELRSILDSGAPLIKGLAARWNVRPGVIRHLVGRASSDTGIQWVRDARGLALALNALHLQDLPSDGPTEWSELPKIDHLRAALAECLHQETANIPSRFASDDDSAIVDAIDRAVLRMAHRGLSEVASLFSDELERRRKKGGTIREILSGKALMTLVPEDFISPDGMTRVTALTTTRELRTHGTMMRNCLRHRSARGLASQGAIGTVFIVGLDDAHSGRALSTAEIKAVPDRQAGAYRLITKQHTAASDRTLSRRCQYSLREFLLHYQSEDVREHLKSGWEKLRQSRGQRRMQPVDLPAA